jgi:predicted DsbA family dithiol-disulfide isomerase
VKLEIYSDIICPWCYIGKARLDKALATLGDECKFEIVWRPFELNPTMAAEGMCRKEYRTCKFGSWERSQEMDRDITAKAAADGLTFNLDKLERTPNTFNAHRLLWYAGNKGSQEKVSDLLFKAYFEHGEDIGAISELVKIAGAAGLDQTETEAFLLSEDGKAEVKDEEQRGIRLGISGVPAFVLDGDVIASGAQSPEEFVRILKRVHVAYSQP